MLRQKREKGILRMRAGRILSPGAGVGLSFKEVKRRQSTDRYGDGLV